MTKNPPPFPQGQLEDACEIHLTATNEGELYRRTFQPTFGEIAKLWPKGEGYDPEVVYLQWLHPADVALAWYRRHQAPGIVWDKHTMRAIVARMLESKYREEVLQACGCDHPDDYIRSFPCDADLKRAVNEF